ncbi:MAG: porin family protein [Parvibaculum sp.]|nr:porin family protein [Parvibaculum sp.]
MKPITRTLCAALVCAGAAGVASGAQAAGTGFYVGGGLGVGFTGKTVTSSIGGTPVNTSIDDEDLTWKLFAGANLNEYIGFELHYADLGSHRTRGVPNSKVSIDSWGGSAILSMPLGNEFSVFAKGGIHRASVNLKAGGTERNTDWLGGLGGKYSLTDNVALRGEWTHYATKRVDVDDFSLSVVFGF